MDGPVRRYLDNAATSHPKPACVARAMARFASEIGASPGRGAYRESREAGDLMASCRRRIARLVNAASPEHVVFTLNTTDALNMAIKGVVMRYVADRRPVHVVTTCMDHNSVLRPFNEVSARFGVEQTRVACDPRTGLVDPADVQRAIRDDTRLVAVVHASNVTGTVQPVGEIGRICRARGIPLVVDGAQSAGHIDLDMERLGIDLLALPGHKGLLGPLGTGVLAMRNGVEHRMITWREGGTGSVSESDVQPADLPDRFESGSHNAIGIIGLGEAVRWIERRGIDAIREHEQRLTRRMLEGLAPCAPAVRLLGPPGERDRVGVFSVVVDGMRPGDVADALEARAGVLCRAGLHCAPLAHRTIGTAPEQVGPDRCGTTRLSIGPFTTDEDVDEACEALASLTPVGAGA